MDLLRWLDRSANHGPLPGESIREALIIRVNATPATIETNQNAKNTEAAAALSASTRSGALPAHVEESITVLAA